MHTNKFDTFFWLLKERVLTQMLCHFQYESGRAFLDLQGVQNGRQSFLKLNVHHSANDGHYLPRGLSTGRCSRCSLGVLSPASCKVAGGGGEREDED